MPLHLVKLCVGAASIEDLAAWQSGRMAELAAAGKTPRIFHTTFQTPKRGDELLDGGSLYWVIKGLIQARQKLVALEEGTKADGSRCCHLILDHEIVPVRPVPRRAFQGWRYLSAADAPVDLSGAEGAGAAEMSAKMRRELAELCLI